VDEQSVDVVLRLTFPFGDVGRQAGAILTVRDRDALFAADGRAAADEARLTWTYADDAANDRQPRDHEVDRAVARRIRGYAGSDPELRGLVAELERDLPLFAAAMPEMSRKQHHFATANLARTRDVYGRSVKGR
jgi:hypothetical protein